MKLITNMTPAISKNLIRMTLCLFLTIVINTAKGQIEPELMPDDFIPGKDTVLVTEDWGGKAVKKKINQTMAKYYPFPYIIVSEKTIKKNNDTEFPIDKFPVAFRVSVHTQWHPSANNISRSTTTMYYYFYDRRTGKSYTTQTSSGVFYNALMHFLKAINKQVASRPN